MYMAHDIQNAPLLKVTGLRKWFPAKRKTPFSPPSYIKAVNDVSFTLGRNETLGVVGESGCGKSTMGRAVMRLIKPTQGEIFFEGVNTSTLPEKEMSGLRGKMQIIFQDPYASLDPRFTVGEAIAEPLNIQKTGTRAERLNMTLEMMRHVGLNEKQINSYPHEFSGGQRQRIGIARAMILKPKLVVCDEPVSALDVSIQGQVINLLGKLQEELGITYIFISHDLSVIRHISDRVMVMYLGYVVELAAKNDLFSRKLHPYTQALLSAIPVPARKVKREKIILQGDLPSPANLPAGCCFHTRCFAVQEKCKTERPELRECFPGHWCACHLAGN
jgi:oligopeptide/dipeptide ABC transporter ATP-binding protein